MRLWFEAENHWCLPTKSDLKKEDKSRIKQLIIDWAERNNEKIEFD